MHVSIDCWVFIEFGEWRREEKGAIMASGIEGEELNDSTTTVIILMITAMMMRRTVKGGIVSLPQVWLHIVPPFD